MAKKMNLQFKYVTFYLTLIVWSMFNLHSLPWFCLLSFIERVVLTLLDLFLHTMYSVVL
jgi:hypothetical protein